MVEWSAKTSDYQSGERAHFTRLFRLRFRKGGVAWAPRWFVRVGAVNPLLICTGRRRVVNRLSMGGRRATADRRYENRESGDYSQDIFNETSRLLFRLPELLSE